MQAGWQCSHQLQQQLPPFALCQRGNGRLPLLFPSITAAGAAAVGCASVIVPHSIPPPCAARAQLLQPLGVRHFVMMPRRIKYRKAHKSMGFNDTICPNTRQLAFGMYGIRAMEHCRIPAKTLEAVRLVSVRLLGRVCTTITTSSSSSNMEAAHMLIAEALVLGQSLVLVKMHHGSKIGMMDQA